MDETVIDRVTTSAMKRDEGASRDRGGLRGVGASLLCACLSAVTIVSFVACRFESMGKCSQNSLRNHLALSLHKHGIMTRSSRLKLRNLQEVSLVAMPKMRRGPHLG